MGILFNLIYTTRIVNPYDFKLHLAPMNFSKSCGYLKAKVCDYEINISLHIIIYTSFILKFSYFKILNLSHIAFPFYK